MKSFIAALAVCFGFASSHAVEKTVSWSLPADWSADVSYSHQAGYCLISGDSLIPRAGLGEVGDPDVPYFRVHLDMPYPSTFKGISYEVAWETVDIGGARPIPVAEPVTTDSEPTLPDPGPAYATVYPVAAAKAEGVIILNGSRKVPVTISPFRWEGPTKTLQKATKLVVTATFEVSDSTARPKTPRKAAARSATARTPAEYGDDSTADFIIVSPPRFVDLWKVYADFRKTTENGRDHTFAIKSTASIYADYASVGGDDAFKIHRYLEDLYALGHIRYVLLGAAPKKYSYDPETMVPSRYVVVRSSIGQVLDAYYGCMHRNPIDANGNELGKEVWDYDGDGTYMGHRNADGTYSCDNSNQIDWTHDIAVFRFPLMEEVVETSAGETIALTAGQVMTNFINKIKFVESETFPGRFSYSLLGTRGQVSSSNSQGGSLVVDERQFFDGGLNMFEPKHSRTADDGEFLPRDRHWEMLTYLRGNNDDGNIIYTSTLKRNTAAQMYDEKANGDVFNVIAHGWARGCSPAGATGAMFAKGCYATYTCPVPCDAGMMDYCRGGSFGITNTICFGEAPILAPKGGALASFTNTRAGWSATYATSANGGRGHYSIRMEWLIMRAMSGVHSKLGTYGVAGDGTGALMDAGTALMYAKNNAGENSPGYPAGLSGCQVTGQGDPLVRYSPQYARVWKADAATYRWNGTDRNWTIPGKDGDYASDYSTDMLADLTGKGDVTFNVETNLSSAGFFVTQDQGATLTIAGDKYRVTRETVVTNGNLVWSAPGGAGRYGVKFVGARGNLALPGDSPRYFGEKFSNVGDVVVSGSNVTIDTPRNATYGAGGTTDFRALKFIADESAPGTNNILRTRKASFLPADFTIPVVNSGLILQVTDNPIIAATNATLTVQLNPQYENCHFKRPLYLNNSTLVNEYVKLAFGAEKGTGFDLYVKGACRLAGTVPIRLNGALRIHFEDAASTLTIENPLTDGVPAGRPVLTGEGRLVLNATTSFTGDLVVPRGAGLELAKLPLTTTIANLTLESGASLHLPATTYPGRWKVVDEHMTTLTIAAGAKVYDKDGVERPGAVSRGYFVCADDHRIWNESGAVWNLDSSNTSWLNGNGLPIAYANNAALKFGDIDEEPVEVKVGAAVVPGLVDFCNTRSEYLFSTEGSAASVTLNTLRCPTPVTFDVPLLLADDVGTVEAGGVFRARRTVGPVAGGKKIKKLRLEFISAKSTSERVAISELYLGRGNSRITLPNGTVVRDNVGGLITVTSSNAAYVHTTTGNNGSANLSALFNGKFNDGAKWWPSQSAAPTWFEITFPVPISPITRYRLAASDNSNRNPKAWRVYATSADGRTNIVQAEADHSYGAANYWIDGLGKVVDFPIRGTMANVFNVRTDGTLVLDGSWHSHLALDENAVLKVDGTSKLVGTSSPTLTLAGSVKVDLSDATVSATPFPILTGYSITSEQFAEFTCEPNSAALILQNGDLYAVTDGLMLPPYRATIAADTNWSAISFTDANNQSFIWDNTKVWANGEVQFNVMGEATLTMDTACKVGALKITGDGSLTVNAAAGVALIVPAELDDSAHTGPLVWNLSPGDMAVKAGADTVLAEAGAGTLEVAAGRHATIPGWSDLTKVSGAGTVSIDAGAKDAVVTWGARAAVTGTNEVLRGTWTIDDTSTYPKDREVVVRGEDAVLQFTTATDVTGYAGYAQALTLADGATWKVDMRDTFSRPLNLVNGAKLLLKQDGTNGGRALDFFTARAQINVRGDAPCIIGGQAADITSTTDSGILAIRRAGFTVEVDEGAVLKVYAQWGTAAGAGGNFVKTGAGVMEQYRAATSALPFRLDGGTLRLVNGGNVTTGGITVADGARLELLVTDGIRSPLTTAITANGSGCVAKTGAGTLAFGTVRPTYPLKLEGGKLRFTVTEAEKTGDWVRLCTLAPGSLGAQDNFRLYDTDGTAEVVISDFKVEDGNVYVKTGEVIVDKYAMPITLAATQPVEFASWLAAPWQDANGKSVEVEDWDDLRSKENLSLKVVADVSVTLAVNMNVVAQSIEVAGTGGVRFVPAGGCALAGPIVGTGVVVFENVWPSLTGFTDAENWRGTVRLAGTVVMTNADFSVFGNENSTIEIAGTVDGGYFKPSGSSPSALCVNGRLLVNNGNSGGNNGYTFSGPLTGSGTIEIAGPPTDVTHFTGDVSGFAGTISVTNVTGQCLAFGPQPDDDTTRGMIVVNSPTPTIAPGKSWSAASGVKVRSGATLTLTPGNTPPITGDATFESGAILNLATDGTAKRYPVCSGTLALDEAAIIQFNGTPASRASWTTSGGSLIVVVEADAYEMPITLAAISSAVDTDWVVAPWEDANGTPVNAAHWEVLLARSDLALKVIADESVTLAVNTNVTATSIEVAGTGGVRFVPTGGCALTGPIVGTGVVVFDNAFPGFAGINDAEHWKGTVRITGAVTLANQDFSLYGNKNSSIEIAGTATGYFLQAGTCPSALCVSGKVSLNNGFSTGGGYTFSGPLTGSGTIELAGPPPKDVIWFTGDVSGFTGTIKVTGSAGQCLAFGEQVDNDTTCGMIVVNSPTATIAPGKVWTAASGVVVRNGATLTLTPGSAASIAGGATVEAGATLNVLSDGIAQRYRISSGTLTLDPAAIIQVNGTTVARDLWTTDGGYLVALSDVTATVEGAPIPSDCDGRALIAIGTSDGFVTLDSPLAPSSLTVKGETLKLKVTGDGLLTTTVDATTAALAIDASGLTGTDLARWAVAGAPYSRWIVKGTVSGTVTVDALPALPDGYEVCAEVLPAHGVRLVVTASDEVQFGAVSLNLHNGTALEPLETLSGAYPVARCEWGNLQVAANAQAEVSNVVFRIGGNASGYGINNAPPDPILSQYFDDRQGSTRTITMSNIGYDRYRIIVYYSTDTANYNFAPLVLNGVTYSAATAGSTTGGTTIGGLSSFWGNTAPNHSAYAPREGVNYLVSDVMTDRQVTLSATRPTTGNARATIAAIQIVKVGEVYTREIAVQPSETGDAVVLPVAETNLVRVVAHVTNAVGEVTATYDVTAAFTLTKEEGGVKAVLNPAAVITIGGRLVAVAPEYDAAHEEMDVGAGAVVVKTIPGLKYELVRGEILGAMRQREDGTTTVVDTKRANGTATKLTDPAPPPKQAFYLIRVAE